MDIHRLLSPAQGEGVQDGQARSSGQTRQEKSPPAPSLQQRALQNSNVQHTLSSTNGIAATSQSFNTSQKPSVAPQQVQSVQTTNRPSLAHRSSSAFAAASQKTTSPYLDHNDNNVRPRLSSIHQHDSGLSQHLSPTPQNIRRLSSKSLTTVTMDEAPVQTPAPRTFTSTALSEEELAQVKALLEYLGDHSYAYSTHVELISLLHKGFATHAASSDPHTYTLLSELRQAREAMDSRFAVGEALWLDWLSDEMALARSSEERVDVIQLLQRATQDEPASLNLWNAFVGWLHSNYDACHSTTSSLPEDDIEVCRAVFTLDLIQETLEQAAVALRWRVDASAQIWNRYLGFIQQHAVHSSIDSVTNRISIQELEQLFLDRLQDPQANVETTLDLFWPIVSQQYGDQAGDAMAGIKASIQPARDQWELRTSHEEKVQSAIDSGDQQALLDEFNHYLKWERTHKKRIAMDKDIRIALFERALLYFPTYVDLWVEYIDFIISQQPSSHNPSKSLLPLLERATKHCPWSGELWSRRILRSDYERRPYDEIEATKHRATNSGLLDVGGMEDLLKVLVEWCSYLRRQAFSATANEDNRDLTEVGITMALEDVQQAGKRMYGDKFEGDPLFRIEQIHIKFLSESRRMEDARNIWRSLIPSKKNSADFWVKYHVWEIALWIIDRVNEPERVETTETGPVLATEIVEQAISQYNLDWPEKVADMYVDHYQWHESVEKVQAATIKVWEFRRKVAAKRARDAEVVTQQMQEQALEQHEEAESSTLKRKRGEEEDVAEDVVKKAKMETMNGDDHSHHKRDRENLSVTLTNLATDTTEKDIRTFFKGCGDILSVEIAPPSDDTTSATVEFSEKSDKDFAKSRSGRSLLGKEVQVHSGNHSTLYVTNYPAEYDEDAIRQLFDAYGEITSVRFPSLKFNNRRRFCYVQFVSYQQAKAAEAAMDGKKLDGVHQLLAKISDPNAKNQRSGAQAQLRELFVKNINDAADEEEVKNLFTEYGTVESVKLLKNVAGKRLGSGFVVFATAEETKEALEKANNRPFQDRILNVTLSTPKGGIAPSVHASKQDIIVKHEDSANQRRGSDVSMASAQSHDVDSHKTIRERQVALFNVPSTVTDARIIAEMEKHGRVNKVQLRREQDAAIVEFDDVKTAFSVRNGMDFGALGPDCKSGDVKDLFSKPKKSAAFKPAMVSRPAQRGARRGGLGFKRGAFSNGAAGEGSGARSNADFKHMFMKGKEEE